MYALVENNTVTETCVRLPEVWRKCSGLPYFEAERLLELGWFPYEEIIPTVAFTELLGPVSYDIQADKVVGTYSVISKPNGQIIAELDKALTDHLDSVAQQDRWTDRITCAVRAGYPNPWQVGCIRFGSWMDECNAYGYQVMDECSKGLRPVPTPAELIAELPPFAWGNE